MTNHELEAQLRHALRGIGASVHPAPVQKTARLAKEALEKKQASNRLSYWAFLGTQVRFIGWKIWLFQAATLLLMAGIVVSMYHSLTERPQFVGFLLSACSFLVFLTALPFLYRSRRYGMCEVEMAAKVSGVRQLGAKLLIIGIGDFSMLCSLFCFALVKTDLSPDSLCLYLLLPFLASASGLMYLIGHTPVSRLPQNSVVVFGLLFLGVSLLTRLMSASRNLTGRGFLVCGLLTFVCVYQTHGIFHHTHYEEIQIL